MKAGNPVPCAGRRRRRARASPRGFSRNKSPAAEEDARQVPVLLLRDMELCYRLLRRLVPGLPPGVQPSRVQILQQVIDYILQLQTELDASCPAQDPPQSPGV